jgi:integrase
MTEPPDSSARSPDLAFAQAWSLWLAYRTYGTRPLRASTLADYESIFRRHLEPGLGALPLSAIDGTVIARFTIESTAAGVNPKRLSNVLVPLRACLRWHHRMGSLAADPAAWFDPPARAADERRILTPVQIEALLGELPARYRPMVAFAAYTGVRAGELRALTWPDVDLDARTARIDKTYFRDRLQRSTKTGHDRTVPIPMHIAVMLAQWRLDCPASPEHLVFPGPGGRPLDLDTFRARVFKPALARAGIPPGTRFHDLRHTSASLYLQSGATLREVMEIHGWRQMQTAVRYLHAPDTLTQAADRLSALGAAARAPT